VHTFSLSLEQKPLIAVNSRQFYPGPVPDRVDEGLLCNPCANVLPKDAEKK
jgi:hypothetical protein